MALTRAAPAEPPGSGPAGFELRVEPLGGPGGEFLVPRVQAEYVARYGGPDATPVDPSEFAWPRGLFLVGYDGGLPVTCGGFRTGTGMVGELKRMYVVPAARRRGLARRMLDALEAAAAAAGMTELRLETGLAQPEAISLYTAAGYRPIPSYGHYRDSPSNVCMAKPLPAGPVTDRHPPDIGYLIESRPAPTDELS